MPTTSPNIKRPKTRAPSGAGYGRLFCTGVVFILSPVLALAAPDPRGDNPRARLLSPAEQRPLFHVPPGFEVQLVAAEPEIQKPLNLNFDSAGRLWVTGSELYPWPARSDAKGEPIASFDRNWNENGVAFRAISSPPKPSERGSDTVRVLSDFGPDGRARRVEVFADGLNIPVGVLPLPRRPGSKGDTLIVYSIPSIWRLEDTDGDGRADTRERLYTEFGFKDTHGMVSNFTYWLDGWIYGTHGFANRSEVRDLSGNVTILESGNTYRFRPDGSRFERFNWGQTNPFGLTFDARGDIYTADSHSKPVYLIVRGGFYEGINKQHDGLGFAPSITLDNHGSSSIAGIACYVASEFPEEYRGNLFNGNPVTRRVNRARLDWTGSTPQAVRMQDFLTCDDPSFRPIQVKLGPDGALWIADFYNPIIGHYEIPLTHPNRDRSHGRIWRVVWHGEDNSVRPPALPDLSKAGAAELVNRLNDSNLTVRILAGNDLTERIRQQDALAALAAGVSAANDDSMLPRAFVGARLGGRNDTALEALTASDRIVDSAAALAALREFSERDFTGSPGSLSDGSLAGRVARRVVERGEPGHVWRALAGFFARNPKEWQASLILDMVSRSLEADTELLYALRLALKSQVAPASIETLRAWTQGDPEKDRRIADVCLAVPTAASAEFLLGHLERTRFSGSRAGEFARHAVLQFPADRLAEVEPLVRSLANASIEQQLALAEGLASVTRQTGRRLPDSVSAWMQQILLKGAQSDEITVARRALDTLKPLEFPGKIPALRSIVLGGSTSVAGIRNAAVNALNPSDGLAIETLATLLARTTESPYIRKLAATQLGSATSVPAAREALGSAISAAPMDLALAIAAALAKSEAGARDLVALIAASRAPAALLRHRYLTLAFESLPSDLRARAAELTAGLPSEDARLEAVIAQRAAEFSASKRNATRGAEVFTQQCAICHRVKNAGGNIGPSLDGIGSRGLQRLVEDVLDPSRNVDPIFRLATVTTKSGESKAGMNLREQGGDYVLTDPSDGHEVRVQKSATATTETLPVSPMPAAFESAIPEKDFFDLLEFLLNGTP